MCTSTTLKVASKFKDLTLPNSIWDAEVPRYQSTCVWDVMQDDRMRTNLVAKRAWRRERYKAA